MLNLGRQQRYVEVHSEAQQAVRPSRVPSPLTYAFCYFRLCSQIKGSQGEDRVVITFNGKFLPFMEQTKEGAAFGVGEEG